MRGGDKKGPPLEAVGKKEKGIRGKQASAEYLYNEEKKAGRETPPERSKEDKELQRTNTSVFKLDGKRGGGLPRKSHGRKDKNGEGAQ